VGFPEQPVSLFSGPARGLESARQAAANGALLTPSKSAHSPTDNEDEKEPE
jgi:hypothetical protein